MAVFEIDTWRQVTKIPVGIYPHDIEVSPDGRFLLAACFGSGECLVIDTFRHEVIAKVRVGDGASHIAFDPGGTRGYVACSHANAVAVIDLAAQKMTGTMTPEP